MGQYISFDMSEVEKMDNAQLNTIMSREYKWKDVSRRSVRAGAVSTVDNVFKERSFKDRDAFWWSTTDQRCSPCRSSFAKKW